MKIEAALRHEATAAVRTRGGVNFAFEMAGSVAAMELEYRVTRGGGRTTAAGGYSIPTIAGHSSTSI